MNDTLIVTVSVILDDLLRAMNHRTDCRAQTRASDVLTVGVIAACQCANHHERALCILPAVGSRARPLSLSRCNRRFHALAQRLSDAVGLLADVLIAGTICVSASMPLSRCRRARAWRCMKVRGAEECGDCAAQKAKVFGWRLHRVISAAGIPVAFDRLPASFPDLTPVHELMERLPSGACVDADKGDNSADDEAWIEGETGIRLIPRRREKRESNTLAETFAVQRYRGRVETVNRPLAAWGVQRLHARTHAGGLCKGLASLFALLCINADEQSGYRICRAVV